MIRGGDWPSTVAGECVTHFRLALYPGRARRRPQGARRADRRGGRRERPELACHRIEVLYEGFQCEGYELAADAPLVTGADRRRARATGQRPPLYASTATTDARTFHLYGETPAVCFGPGRRERARGRRARAPALRHARPRRRSRCSSPTGAASRRRLTNRARGFSACTVGGRRRGQPGMTHGSTLDGVREARERYVSSAVATPPLVVVGAEGARIEADDGRSYIDFAGGIGCQNLGHGPPRSSPRSTSRSTATCTSASWSACTSRTSRSAGGSPSCTRARHGLQERAPELGRRGGRERGQDRPRGDRPAGRDRVRPRVPRPHAADDDDDQQGRPYKRGFGPFAPEVYRAGAVRLPRSRPTTRSTRSGACAGRGRPRERRLRRARARAGRGRLHSDAARLPGRCRSCARRTGSSTSTTRCRPASAAPARCGRSSTTAWSPTCSSPASRSAAASRSPR